MSLTKLSLGRNNLNIPGPAGAGKNVANLFYGVGADRLVQNQMTYRDGLGDEM